jgi:hypothetical protein
MVSTPNRSDGLFAKTEKEPFESSIYKKLFLDYTYGLNKIYTEKEIEKAKRSPSFPREFELQYQGLIADKNREPLITSIQNDMSKEVEIRHEPPIRGGFAELQKKGLRIKDYHTTEKE